MLNVSSVHVDLIITTFMKAQPLSGFSCILLLIFIFIKNSWLVRFAMPYRHWYSANMVTYSNNGGCRAVNIKFSNECANASYTVLSRIT